MMSEGTASDREMARDLSPEARRRGGFARGENGKESCLATCFLPSSCAFSVSPRLLFIELGPFAEAQHFTGETETRRIRRRREWQGERSLTSSLLPSSYEFSVSPYLLFIELELFAETQHFTGETETRRHGGFAGGENGKEGRLATCFLPSSCEFSVSLVHRTRAIRGDPAFHRRNGDTEDSQETRIARQALPD